MLLPVILAGGTGSRLWPMSRELHPKQFLRLHNMHSMLQETLKRLEGVETDAPVVICNQDHRFIADEQLLQMGIYSHSIILEPIGRNTAPAIALAALHAVASGHDPVMLVLAADHIITDVAAFHYALAVALPYATQQSLVTFGITPSAPETGYGYILRGEKCGADGLACRVQRFVEKPNLTTAQNYLNSGEYFWNSGIFIFRAQRYLEELGKFRPDILQACRLAWQNSEFDKNFIHINAAAFRHCPDESIDYAVMEKTHDAVMIPLDAGWSDVGSWSALWEVSPKDDAGNALTGDTFLHNVHDCYINTDEKLVAAIGVDNLVIVNTKDAVLVINKPNVQDVKKVVEKLKKDRRSEYRTHAEIHQPWGTCDLLSAQKYCNVNRITLNPGKSLSFQLPAQDREHWVILTGTAKITSGDQTIVLCGNQSTLITGGEIYCLENPGNTPLVLIEIQTASSGRDDENIRIQGHR
ncbi:mannose-1-phosphate guanylyltransferase/mannose-6-phosphate isomerase [Pantoea sp. B65]|uniref:mannose-1-phosphate guanylyltransferase/mannose-6-phosphate isomerase n=1 Tax=Pantoea sp. B65 TaxID=2813359 RepID=UPI0039B5A270